MREIYPNNGIYDEHLFLLQEPELWIADQSWRCYLQQHWGWLAADENTEHLGSGENPWLVNLHV